MRDLELVDVNTKFEITLERVSDSTFRIKIDGLDWNEKEFVDLLVGEAYQIDGCINKENIFPPDWDNINYPKPEKKKRWWELG